MKMKKRIVALIAWTLLLALGILVVLACTAAIAEGAEAPIIPEAGELTWLTQYVDGVILGICLIVGVLIKHATPIDNKYIPVIVALIGVGLALWIHWGALSPVVLLTGMTSGLASTGMHQLVYQVLIKG